MAARKLYIGNIPRNVGNEELTRIVEEHGAVEKAEVRNFCLELFFSFGILNFCLIICVVLDFGGLLDFEGLYLVCLERSH